MWLVFPDVYSLCSFVIFIDVIVDGLHVLDEEMKLENQKKKR